MSSQPIKSLVTVRNIAQLSRLDSASNEQIVDTYQCTESIASLIRDLLPQARKKMLAIITGERGVGKSHLLAFLRALMEQLDLTSKIELPPARKIISEAIDRKLRAQTTVTINCESEQPDIDLLISRSDAQIEKACSSGNNVVVFLDGLSPLLRKARKHECLQWLTRLAKGITAERFLLFITLDQDLLNFALPILEQGSVKSALGTIPLNNLAEAIDQFIFVKRADQRQTIEKLYDEISRKVPAFAWSRREFTMMFPLHPRVLSLVPALRTYGRTFSLFSFLATVAPRATMRRGTSLISLSELFDTFEFDLRRNLLLNHLFATYDHLVENFAKALPDTQQFHGRLLLRALTLLSLTEKAYTILEIADSVMLFDDSSPILLQQSLKSIIDLMAATAGEKMIIVNGNEPRYQLRLAQANIISPITEAARDINDEDPRLVEILLDSGKNIFKDWPLLFKDNNFIRRSEGELFWRGTARRGIFKVGGASELVIGPMRKIEWQLTLVPPFALNQAREEVRAGENLIYWYPDPLTKEELSYLKRMLVLKLKGAKFLTPEEMEREKLSLTTEINKTFFRAYLEMGRTGGATEDSTKSFNFQEKRLAVLLGNIFEGSLKARLPYHPIFGDFLTERILRVLTKGFFYKSEWSLPETRKYLGQIALPLHIVIQVGDQYEYAVASDIPADTPLGAIFQAIERSDNHYVSRSELERLLRCEPYGLQQSILLVLVLGAAAAGHIVLTDENGETILNKDGIRKGYDITQYSCICLASTPTVSFDPGVEMTTTFQQPLEDLFQEVVSEALSTPLPDEKPLPDNDDEEILEFYQSGIFSKSNVLEPNIRSATNIGAPAITKRIEENATSLSKPTKEETEEDEILEFYQSGFFSRSPNPEVEKSTSTANAPKLTLMGDTPLAQPATETLENVAKTTSIRPQTDTIASNLVSNSSPVDKIPEIIKPSEPVPTIPLPPANIATDQPLVAQAALISENPNVLEEDNATPPTASWEELPPLPSTTTETIDPTLELWAALPTPSDVPEVVPPARFVVEPPPPPPPVEFDLTTFVQENPPMLEEVKEEELIYIPNPIEELTQSRITFDDKQGYPALKAPRTEEQPEPVAPPLLTPLTALEPPSPSIEPRIFFDVNKFISEDPPEFVPPPMEIPKETPNEVVASEDIFDFSRVAAILSQPATSTPAISASPTIKLEAEPFMPLEVSPLLSPLALPREEMPEAEEYDLPAPEEDIDDIEVMPFTAHLQAKNLPPEALLLAQGVAEELNQRSAIEHPLTLAPLPLADELSYTQNPYPEAIPLNNPAMDEELELPDEIPAEIPSLEELEKLESQLAETKKLSLSNDMIIGLSEMEEADNAEIDYSLPHADEFHKKTITAPAVPEWPEDQDNESHKKTLTAPAVPEWPEDQDNESHKKTLMAPAVPELPEEEYGFDTLMDEDTEPATPEMAQVFINSMPAEPIAPVEQNIGATPNDFANNSTSRLVLVRKLTNEKMINKELPLIYDKFSESCQYHIAPVPMPTIEQFHAILQESVKLISLEAKTSEIWCYVEIIDNEVQVNCQARRTTLFQGKSARHRIF